MQKKICHLQLILGLLDEIHGFLSDVVSYLEDILGHEQTMVCCCILWLRLKEIGNVLKHAITWITHKILFGIFRRDIDLLISSGFLSSNHLGFVKRWFFLCASFVFDYMVKGNHESS